MARLMMIGLRLVAGSDDAELVGLVRSALAVARAKGFLSDFPPRLARTEAGCLLLVTELNSVATVDAMDEDIDLQDVIMQISALAESFPLHSLVEFNANRVTFETMAQRADIFFPLRSRALYTDLAALNLPTAGGACHGP